MTDAEWIALCLLVASCSIVAILLHTYGPMVMEAAINGTHALVVGSAP